jgi:DNA-binding MarR family transcriptional regulator
MQKTTSAADTAAILRHAIGRASRRLRQHAGAELTPAEVAIVATIAQHGPISPSEIAELEQVSRPAVTRIVTRLVDRGLLIRDSHESDRRSYVLSVSPDGAALRASRGGRKTAYLENLLQDTDEDDLQLLAEAAALLLEILEDNPEGPEF